MNIKKALKEVVFLYSVIAIFLGMVIGTSVLSVKAWSYLEPFEAFMVSTSLDFLALSYTLIMFLVALRSVFKIYRAITPNDAWIWNQIDRMMFKLKRVGNEGVWVKNFS